MTCGRRAEQLVTEVTTTAAATQDARDLVPVLQSVRGQAVSLAATHRVQASVAEASLGKILAAVGREISDYSADHPGIEIEVSWRPAGEVSAR